MTISSEVRGKYHYLNADRSKAFTFDFPVQSSLEDCLFALKYLAEQVEKQVVLNKEAAEKKKLEEAEVVVEEKKEEKKEEK